MNGNVSGSLKHEGNSNECSYLLHHGFTTFYTEGVSRKFGDLPFYDWVNVLLLSRDRGIVAKYSSHWLIAGYFGNISTYSSFWDGLYILVSMNYV